MTKTVLNKKGMILYGILLLAAIITGVYDTPDTTNYIISKIITLIIIIILLILSNFIPKKYTDE